MTKKAATELDTTVIPPTEADFKVNNSTCFARSSVTPKRTETGFPTHSTFGIAYLATPSHGSRWTRNEKPMASLI